MEIDRVCKNCLTPVCQQCGELHNQRGHIVDFLKNYTANLKLQIVTLKNRAEKREETVAKGSPTL